MNDEPAMKKINSIDYGGKAIGIGLAFLMAIPAMLYVLNRFLHLSVIQTLMTVSLMIGAIIEAGFGCVLLIELRQDRIIRQCYEANPSSKRTSQQILDSHRRKLMK